LVHSNPLALETNADLETELAHFRNQWKSELTNEKPLSTAAFSTSTTNQDEVIKFSNLTETGRHVAKHQEFARKRQPKPAEPRNSESTEATRDLDYDEPNGVEEKAQYLFNKAVLLEQQSRHYEAIKFYRLAMQLDADIEFKVAFKRSSKNTSSKDGNSNKKNNIPLDDDDNDDENADEKDTKSENKGNNEGKNEETDSDLTSLYEQFQAFSLFEAKFCQMNYPQKVLRCIILHYLQILLLTVATCWCILGNTFFTIAS
jgi:hypothetical protein